MTEARIRSIFLGTPEFALPSLEALLQSSLFEVCAVVTQPDRPAGRGLKTTAPPVKVLAESHNVPVFQPKSIKNIVIDGESGDGKLRGEKSSAPLADFLNTLLPLDAVVCVAYGKIIPASLLDFASTGVINVHPSLLPRWRGAAPIQRAVFAGDRLTGVSIMKLDEGVDSGPVFAARSVELERGCTSGELHDRLARLGADLLLSVLPDIAAARIKAVEQDDKAYNYADKWDKEDARILWSETAEVCERRICASAPRPGARCSFGGDLLKVHRAAEVFQTEGLREAAPGTIVEANERELIAACAGGSYLSLEEVQFPGRKKITASEVFRGRHLKQGDLLG